VQDPWETGNSSNTLYDDRLLSITLLLNFIKQFSRRYPSEKVSSDKSSEKTTIPKTSLKANRNFNLFFIFSTTVWQEPLGFFKYEQTLLLALGYLCGKLQ
jgi:hypothetical protein